MTQKKASKAPKMRFLGPVEPGTAREAPGGPRRESEAARKYQKMSGNPRGAQGSLEETSDSLGKSTGGLGGGQKGAKIQVENRPKYRQKAQGS